MMKQISWTAIGSSCLLLGLASGAALGDDDEKNAPATTVKLGRGGHIVLETPGDWESKKPRFRMIDYEFAAPAKEEGGTAARVTIMGAGGDVKQNIERWKDQFQDQGRKFATQQMTIADQEVHTVDVSGTYLDRPAPMLRDRVTPRPNYRVLAAIMVTSYGRYYVKMYGPESTVSAHEKGFQKMIRSLAVQ
jgi:hypothetical protein